MRGRLVLPFFLFFKAANFAAARAGQPVPQSAFDCRKAGSACSDRDRSRRTHTRRPDIFSACTLHRGASGFPAQRDRLFPRWSARPPPAGVRRLCEPPKVITLLPSNRFLAFLDLCSRGERKNRGSKAREEARRKRGVKQERPARKNLRTGHSVFLLGNSSRQTPAIFIAPCKPILPEISDGTCSASSMPIAPNTSLIARCRGILPAI